MSDYLITMYVADKRLNEFMKAMGMCSEYKVFVSEPFEVNITLSFPADDLFFQELIQVSKTNSHFWTPRITYAGKDYYSPEIKEISNGKKIIFTCDLNKEGD